MLKYSKIPVCVLIIVSIDELEASEIMLRGFSLSWSGLRLCIGSFEISFWIVSLAPKIKWAKMVHCATYFCITHIKKMLKNVGRKEGVIMTLPKSQCFFQTWLFEYGEIFIIIENLHWSKTQIINPKSIWTNIAHLSTFNHKTADCIVMDWIRSNCSSDSILIEIPI